MLVVRSVPNTHTHKIQVASMQVHHACIAAVLILVSLLGVSAQPTKCLNGVNLAATATPNSTAVDKAKCCTGAGMSGTVRCIRYCESDKTVSYATVDKNTADLMIGVAEDGSTHMGTAHFVCDKDNCNVKIDNPCAYKAPAVASPPATSSAPAHRAGQGTVLMLITSLLVFNGAAK